MQVAGDPGGRSGDERRSYLSLAGGADANRCRIESREAVVPDAWRGEDVGLWNVALACQKKAVDLWLTCGN